MRWLSKLLKRFFISTLLIGMAWAVCLWCYVASMPTEPQTSTVKVDAAIVLTGGAARIEHGFARVSEGVADQLFISGVNDETTPEHIIMTVKQSVKNISDEQVTLGYKARSTIGNAMEAGWWIGENRITSIRLITANYHMPRSLLEFNDSLPADIHIITDPVFPDGFDISRWLSDSNSRRLVMSEYHKFIASYIRHWILKLEVSLEV